MWRRAWMAAVGLVVLSAHAVVALGGVLILAWLAANPPGVVPAVLAFAGGVLLAGYVGYRSGTVQLVASLRARELPRGRAPALYRRFDRLCASMAVEQPPILVADLDAPNALSVGGPRRGVVVIDQRLLRGLTIDELEGILAHELAHMESHDTFVNTLALTAMRSLVGVVFLALFPVVVVLVGVDRALAWFAGRPRWQPGVAAGFKLAVVLVLGVVLSAFTLAYLAYSRRREFAADRRAVDATGRPAALARALAKIHRANDPRSGLLSVLYTHDDRTDQRRLFSTHPPVEKRIERLLDRADHDGRRHHVGRIRPS